MISSWGVLFFYYSRGTLRDNKHCLKQTNQRAHNHEDDSVENELEREFKHQGIFLTWDWPRDGLRHVCVKQAKIQMPQVISKTRTNYIYAHYLWEDKTAPIRKFVQSLNYKRLFLATTAPRNLASRQPRIPPEVPKSQFPRQITSWLASKNPQLHSARAVACFAVSPCAMQLTIWCRKNEEKKHYFEARDGTIDIFPNYRTSSTFPWATIFRAQKNQIGSLSSHIGWNWPDKIINLFSFGARGAKRGGKEIIHTFCHLF